MNRGLCGWGLTLTKELEDDNVVQAINNCIKLSGRWVPGMSQIRTYQHLSHCDNSEKKRKGEGRGGGAGKYKNTNADKKRLRRKKTKASQHFSATWFQIANTLKTHGLQYVSPLCMYT